MTAILPRLAAVDPVDDDTPDRHDVLEAAVWRAEDFDFWAFDRRLDALAGQSATLRVAAAVAEEVRIRAQRLLPRRNPGSRTVWFQRVLVAHRGLHDLDRPLVRADLDHALDTWQWMLRLDAEAPAAAQLAALLHDVERLGSEGDARVEHLALDYQAFKDAHAHGGAVLAAALLDAAEVPEAVSSEAVALVAGHERVTAATQLLGDADALSFFSLNSPGYLRYFGPAQTEKKVAYSLARMSPAARRQLPGLRLPARVREQVAHAA